MHVNEKGAGGKVRMQREEVEKVHTIRNLGSTEQSNGDWESGSETKSFGLQDGNETSPCLWLGGSGTNQETGSRTGGGQTEDDEDG